MNIAVFASGNGSNLQALIDGEAKGQLGKGKITLVVSDKAEAFALSRAQTAGIKTFILEAGPFKSREEYDRKIHEKLQEENIELIILAGFMRILSDFFVDKYQGRILNIHPALLPSFGGKGMWGHHVHEAVLAAGCKVSGCTVHICTNEYDKGPIVIQRCCPVENDDTADSLAQRVFEQECIAYPDAIRLFEQGKIRVEQGRAKIVTATE